VGIDNTRIPWRNKPSVFAGSLYRRCRFNLAAISVLILAMSTSAAIAEHRVIESRQANALIDASGFNGATLVYDLSENSYTAGHAELIHERYIPASTFKIFSALVALETGVIATADSVIEWDGITRERSELNRDLELTTAFRISAVPHFQELVRRIGARRMQHFLDEVGYGNRDISGGIDTFWLSGGLRISLWEQVEFLSRLQRGDLPFSPAVIAAVRDMMLTETGADYRIRAKTGLATLADDQTTGWWIGWLERDSEIHLFATVLQTRAPEQSIIPARLELTRKVLQLLDVLNEE